MTARTSAFVRARSVSDGSSVLVACAPGSERGIRIALALGVIALLWGCGGKPRPPALQQGDGPFHSPSAGLRFQPPKGWRQFTHGIVPPGPVPKEVPVVKYKLQDGKRMALLRVGVVDLPEPKSVEQYLRERPPGHEDWRAVSSKNETVDVNGLPGVRVAFTGRWDGRNAVKEVVGVRRGGRLYSFTGIYGAGDTRARDAVRQAVATVTWEGSAI